MCHKSKGFSTLIIVKMLHEIAKKVKEIFKDRQGDLFLAFIVFFTGIASFGLGRLSAIVPPREQMRIIEPFKASEGRPASVTQSVQISPERVVGSKNGSAYHLPDCAGATKIKEENKIWFASAALAEEAGYRPASNCPGLR